MKRKIFASMCILAFLTVLLSALFISSVMYGEFYDNMKQRVKNEATYIAASINLVGEDYLDALKNISDKSRITLIASNGTVLFDTAEKAETMGNHLSRPEVSSALHTGAGEAVRLSETLGAQTFYYAVRLDHGMVLRVANRTNSVFSAMFSMLPFLFLVVVFVYILAMLLANWQTKKIVIPLNNLDLENPLSNDIYDELSPLLSRIAKQNNQIKSQLMKLREKQDEFSAITENMNEGLVILDNKASILSINKSALRLFNVKRADTLNSNILTINRSLTLLIAVEKALSNASTEEKFQMDGHHYQLLASPVLANDAVKGVILLILDVTEKHAIEQMRREFSANVSHELKTPLTSISGYAEIMKNGLVKPEDIPRFSERIYTEAIRLITLVEDIIKLSRLDEKKMDLPQEDVDLLTLSQEISMRLAPQASQRGIQFTVTGANAVIRGIKQVLDEMIYNLCSNAIKYNYEKGKVDISISYTPRGTVLSVADTGIGIAKEHQSRVFERFYRVDKSHSKETGGTGLGLSIVKHGAMVHHAKLELESELGKGTVIRIIFP